MVCFGVTINSRRKGKSSPAIDLGLAAPAEGPDLNLRAVRQRAEADAIQQALIRTAGNISRAAEVLGITRPTLYDLMAKLEIRDPMSDDAA